MININKLSVKIGAPPIKKVVILYSEDYWIKRLILEKNQSFTIPLFPESVHLYFSLKLFKILFSKVLSTNLNNNLYEKNIYGAIKKIYDYYIISLIDLVNPNCVLTFIDNGSKFFRLCQIDKKRKYIAIQNGFRISASYGADKKNLNSMVPYVDELFCHGERDRELLANINSKIQKITPLGSIVGSYYKYKKSKMMPKKKFDVAYISQWNKKFFDKTNKTFSSLSEYLKLGHAMFELTKLISLASLKINLRVIICLRNNCFEEVNFFKQFFGERVKFSKYNRAKFSTYKAIEQSELVVALHSTVLAEAFSWGKKVLWSNATCEADFRFHEAGISYFEGNNLEQYCNKITSLLKMDSKIFKKKTKKHALFFNKYDPNKPSYKVLKEYIKDYKA